MTGLNQPSALETINRELARFARSCKYTAVLANWSGKAAIRETALRTRRIQPPVLKYHEKIRNLSDIFRKLAEPMQSMVCRLIIAAVKGSDPWNSSAYSAVRDRRGFLFSRLTLEHDSEARDCNNRPVRCQDGCRLSQFACILFRSACA